MAWQIAVDEKVSSGQLRTISLEPILKIGVLGGRLLASPGGVGGGGGGGGGGGWGHFAIPCLELH